MGLDQDGASPPGLWQPPTGGASGGPPSGPPGVPPRAPPPGVPQNFGGAAGVAGKESQEFGLQKEVSGTIEAQVARLLEQARRDTEAKVKTELGQIYSAMMNMDQRLNVILSQVEVIERQEHEPHLDTDAIRGHLSKVEKTWGQEIRQLKQELHQTILAHNHNADLIKHHKDTIDHLQRRCNELRSGDAKTAEGLQRLQRLDKVMKQQAPKMPKVEPLMQRVNILEQRIAASAAASAAAASAKGGWGGYPRTMPAMGPPGMGMMPPGIDGQMLAGKGGCKGGGGIAHTAQPKAAYKQPTDEEVQKHFGKLSGGGEAAAVAPVAPAVAVPAPAAATPPPTTEETAAPPASEEAAAEGTAAAAEES